MFKWLKEKKESDDNKRKTRRRKSQKSSEDFYTNKPKRKLLDIGLCIPSQTAKYTIRSVLGSGGFGEVYKVQKESDGQNYALKTEDATGRDIRLRRLKIEAEVLDECGKSQNPHFLALIDKGRTDTFKFIVMPVVWLTLDKIRSDIIKTEQYSRSCAFKINGQMLESVRDLHAIGYLHRDLKPANFAVGLAEHQRSIIYIFDFGICRKYLDANGRHIAPRSKVSFMGTPRFAPRSAHSMSDQSRKDDLESLCYVMVDIFHNAVIPWRGQRDRVLLLQLKDNFINKRGSVAVNAYAKLPPEFEKLVRYVETLTYDQSPFYEYMIEEITAPVKNCIEPMDWIGLEGEKPVSSDEFKIEKQQDFDTMGVSVYTTGFDSTMQASTSSEIKTNPHSKEDANYKEKESDSNGFK